jgi:DNA polymerase-3 subunit alpha
MAALLTTVMGSQHKLAEYIEDCRQLGITVLPPDVNYSVAGFSVEGDAIRFGLSAIKNVGVHAIESIVRNRKHKGYYRDLFHFCASVDPRACNKRLIESLILSGATASLPGHRAQQLALLDEAVEYGVRVRRERDDNQLSLFSADSQSRGEHVKLPDVRPYPREKELVMERELLGLYLTGHPLEPYRAHLRQSHVVPVRGLQEKPDGTDVRVAGRLVQLKPITTKKGEPMAFATLEDLSRQVEIVVFPRLYQQERALWKEDELVLVEGKVNHRDDDVTVIAEDVRPLTSDSADMPPAVYVRIPAEEQGRRLQQLKGIIARHRGTSPVYLYYVSSGKVRALPPEKYGLNWTESCRQAIEAVFGKGCVKVKERSTL